MKNTISLASILFLFSYSAYAQQSYPDYVGGSRTDLPTDGNIINTIDGGEYRNVLGGNGSLDSASYHTGAVNGNVTLTLNNTKVYGWLIVGNTGNKNFDSENDYIGGISGKVTLNFNGDSYIGSNPIGFMGSGIRGGISGATTAAKTGAVELNFNGGLVNTFVMAAGGNSSATIENDVVINLNGSTFNGEKYSSVMGKTAIMGVQGCYDPTNTLYGYGSATAGNSMSDYIGGRVYGSVIVNMTAGEVNGNIWGAYADSRIDGGVHYNLSGGTVNGDLHLGVAEWNAYVGKSDITLSGDAHVNGTLYGKMDSYVGAKERYMESATLNIGTNTKSYNTKETINVVNFDKVNVNSDATVSANIEGITKKDSGVNGDGIIQLNNGSTLKLINSSIKNNSHTLSQDYKQGSYGLAFFLSDGTSLSVRDSQISENSIVANKPSSAGNLIVYGGIASTRNGSNSEFDNVIFDSNSASSSYRVQGGVLQVSNQSFNEATVLTINNSQFSNNKAFATNKARGGAIENYQATLNVSNTIFDGNSVNNKAGETYTASNFGGAIYTSETLAKTTLTDVIFTNNAANNGYGGAISAEGSSSILINATKNALFSGNYATDADGNKDDSHGGFLHLSESANAQFNISNGATLTIGNGKAGYDSIVTQNSGSSIIEKQGAGTLIVNSSMQYFTGALNINAGVMEVNAGLGAKTVSIAESATLSAILNAGMFASTDLVNNGTLVLKRGVDLLDTATVSLKSYAGSGEVQTFGGSFENGVFTAGSSKDYDGTQITVGNADTDVQSVSLGEKDLRLDFDVSKMGEDKLVINAIEAVTDKGNIKGEFLTGYSVNASYDDSTQMSIVFSAYVGEVEADKVLAWHKADGATDWEQLATEISFENGVASIIVDGFSSYAFSQVPEPSTYAAIFGALALAFAIYRRRR